MIRNKNVYKYILKSCFVRLIFVYLCTCLILINLKITIKKVEDRK